MDNAKLFRRTSAAVNRATLPLLGTGVGRRLCGGWLAEVRYRGRRSGREFRFPVGYQRAGGDVTIRVGAPGVKTWWRSSLGAGAPMHLRLADGEHHAFAVTERDAAGRVVVTARLG